MKKLILFILVISVGVIHAQKQNAEIYLRNGEVLKGYVRLAKLGKVDYFKNKKIKSIRFNNKDIEKIKIIKSKNIKYLYSILLKETGKYDLLEKILIGKVSLYKESVSGSIPISGFAGSYTEPSNWFYVIKKGEIGATFIGRDKLSIKRARKYFSDCSLFLENLKSRKFKRRKILKMIEFYNKECLN